MRFCQNRFGETSKHLFCFYFSTDTNTTLLVSISLLQMKYILFLSVGENTAGTDDIKGIVSRDFEGLQIILMNRSWVPDDPLVVCYFLNFRFHISSKF